MDPEIDAQSGVYRWAERSSNYPLNRYTVFVRFGEGDLACIEEVDVDVRDDTDARVLASVVLERDYEAGGVIVEVMRREKGWMYF